MVMVVGWARELRFGFPVCRVVVATGTECAVPMTQIKAGDTRWGRLRLSIGLRPMGRRLLCSSCADRVIGKEDVREDVK